MKGGQAFCRRDANHEEIVNAYESVYASVLDLHTVGHGCPDLLVGISGVNCLVEIKSADGALEESQKTFIKCWRGELVWVVRSVEDVRRHVNGVRAGKAALINDLRAPGRFTTPKNEAS